MLDPKKLDPRITGTIEFKGKTLTVTLLTNGQHLDMELAARAKMGGVDSQTNKDLVNATYAFEKAATVTLLPEAFWMDKIHGFDRDYMAEAFEFVGMYTTWEQEKLASLKNS